VALEFLHQLQSGDLGVRALFPASLERLEEAARAALLRDPERRVAWEIAFVPFQLDLRDATEPVLRADLEVEARAAFEATWSALAPDAELSARPAARTSDPAWSPIVAVDRPLVDAAPVLRVIHRMSYEPGHELVVGRVLAPTAQGVLSIAASNLSRATGYRESARVMAALASHDGADPEAVKRELGQAGLDDATYDLLFPEHPLSLVRAALAWLLDAEGGGLSITSPASASAEAEIEIELAAARCAITPPPRYLPLPDGALSLSPSRATLTRVGLAVTTPRTLDVWRIEGASILGPGREQQLARLARKNAADWADEGATDVTAKVTKLPSKDGRAHVRSRVRFTTPAGPTHSAARWMVDTDGAVFRIAASGGTWIPEGSLLEDAEQALRSLRRLDPPAPLPEPKPLDAVKPKRTWWPFS
jgi:hypothetical protein